MLYEDRFGNVYTSEELRYMSFWEIEENEIFSINGENPHDE